MDDLPSYPGTPRWVKVSAIIAGVVVLLLVAVMLFGGGRHGPGRHLRSDDAGGTPPASVIGDPAPSGGPAEAGR